MREINKIAESLFEKIRDRFEDVSLGDENAKATQDPQKARFFNFDYVINNNNHGNITMSLIDEMSLKIYFSKNISHDMADEDKKEWYSFLRELREFAKRNLLSFEPRDITRSTLKHRDLQQVSKADSTYDKDEVIAESRMYGTLNRSYEDFGPVRIKVAHAKPVMDETRGARSRNIEAVFVENDQGERFRMPFNSLIGTRAMARHISAGGTPSDQFGQHITEMVNEMLTLRPFIHSMRHRTFEDATTNDMLESAFGYHGLLKNTLKKLKGKKGYNEYKETYQPPLNETDEFDAEELREKFVKKVFPDKLAEALPLVHKAYKVMKENNNPYAQQFENWAETVAEGSWALPDTEDDVGQLIDWFSQERPVGVDAQSATNELYNIVGDDRLFDRLEELADSDPEADARDLVADWLQDNLPHIYQQIANEIGDPDYPAEPADSEGGEIDEGKEFGAYTHEKLAMGLPAGLTDEKQILQFGYNDLKSVLGKKRADYYFNYDEDFASDFVSAYFWLQKNPQTTGEGTHGQAIPGSTQNMLATTNEGEWQEDDVEAIQSAIIRRILNNIGEHSELLKKAGPEGVMNAARDVASFHAPVEELGTSDISIMVREVYREVGVEYPEVKEEQEIDDNEEVCVYCGEPRGEKYGCCGENHWETSAEHNIDEAKDTIKYDPKTGKLTGWEHEGDWKKQTTKKDPVGKIHHMSDVARRRTEKMADKENVEEMSDKDEKFYKKESPKKKAALQKYYDWLAKNADKDTSDYYKYAFEQAVEEDTDYSEYDKPTFLRKNPKELPKKSGWTGYNTDEPAYKRKADYEQEREQLKKLAGVK